MSLPDFVDNSSKIFADDTKLYGSVHNNISLQNDLLSLLEWSDKWQLKFNTSKCGVLHIGNKNPNHDYFMDKDLKS